VDNYAVIRGDAVYTRSMKNEMQQTSKGMIREGKDEKLNYLSYCDPLVDLRYAKYMKIGEKKHGAGNWKKGGYDKYEALQSLKRHLKLLTLEIEYGIVLEDIDHASGIRFNTDLFMLIEEQEKLEEPSLLEQSDYSEGINENSHA